MKPSSLQCLACRKDFPYRASHGIPYKFCSRECFSLNRQASAANVSQATTCQQCGREFTRRAGRGTEFCSQACRKAHTTAQHLRECPVCGKSFRAKSDRYKTCSKECQFALARTSEKRACLICGTEFWVNQTRIKAGHGKYCSTACCGKSKEKDEPETVTDTCQQCGSEYQRMPHDRDRKFCSKECHYLAARRPDTEERTCEMCGTAFLSRAGLFKHCSKQCQSAAAAARKASRAKTTTCLRCGRDFEYDPARNHQHRHKPRFCSPECKQDSKQSVTCEHCGKAFQGYKYANRKFCSEQCRDQHKVAENATQWKGGRTMNYNGEVLLYSPTDGFAGVYRPEHRLISAQAIGRDLDYDDEPVLHLNGDNSDNRPENLYVCGSRSECMQIIAGSRPFPRASNLDELRQATEEACASCSPPS